MSEKRPKIQKALAKIAEPEPIPPLENQILVRVAVVLEGVASCMRCRCLVKVKGPKNYKIAIDLHIEWLELVRAIVPRDAFLMPLVGDQSWSVARPGRDHFCSHAIIPAEGKFPESNS
ncbi:hypothetical protein [Singulisphaera sp. PoT]|uniref:hypothetical protein n=1 Tax=Singulisphaera sp. PoT TaxID=3411797 RepID=UPI003BF5F957